MTASASHDGSSHVPHVCLVVPNGSHRPGPLARALAELHPELVIGAIWCGDPQLRPPAADGVPWWDRRVLDAPATAPVHAQWHEVLVADPPLTAQWRAAVSTVRERLAGGASTVTLLWVGAIAVLDDASALWAGEPSVRLVVRCTGPVPDDGAMPDEHELAVTGRFTPHAATFGRDGLDALSWLDRRIAEDGESELGAGGRLGVGRWLELMTDEFPIDSCVDERIGVGAWRWNVDDPAVLDVAGYDARKPWVLDPNESRRTRIGVVGHPARRRALVQAAPQLDGERRPLVAPGGIVIDDVVRRVARPPAAMLSTPGPASPMRPPRAAPPSPWTQPARFREWLTDRYWTELHSSRPDLSSVFPRPTTADAPFFRTWTRRACLDDQVGFMLPPIPPDVATAVRFETAEEPRHDGLNLVGYFRRESSLGDVARRLASAAEAAGVPTTLLAHERTASPTMHDPPDVDHRVEFATTLAVVNADQFPTLGLDHPELIGATRRMIGYWFWELAYIPPQMRAMFAAVDEIWAGSQFVVDAFAAVAPVPVRHVPIPVAQPVASDRQRASFGPLAGLGERFVFGVVLDHFSVTERKNPIGAIDAFRRAFRPDEGPVLVIKSMNAGRRWPQHQEVQAAAEGRSDIVVWDEHLSRADHMAFIRSVDALVSLHRSEGLGLHLAEAMWLGTPTIATRYSGNLDFMDDECSMLVDATMVPVGGGEGVYPSSATWAEPDIDDAAASMRRLVAEPALRSHLASAGLVKMRTQPSLVHTGQLIADLAGVRDGSAATRADEKGCST